MAELPPLTLRDFSKGRVTRDAVSDLLIPYESVSNSINVNFDDIIGAAKVRLGTTKIGDTVAENRAPTGFGAFVGPGGNPDLLLVVHQGDAAATLRYFDTAWHDSNLVALDNTKKNRFAVLGGNAFVTNSSNGMSDSPDGAAWGAFGTDNSIPTSVLPSLVYRYAARLLAAGDPTYPDRVFFSSIVDQAATPFLTWDVDPSTGDWIDVNPDDGGYVTGFSEASTFVLVFKTTGMYRLDTVTKSTNPQNIYNVGAVSQEGITLCQGVTYYFSGFDIRRTNGGYPEQISRLGVQDFINAIQVQDWGNVAAGTDGLNVYFSIGDVTLNPSRDNQRTYHNVELKFSPRDETWSVHERADRIFFYAPYVQLSITTDLPS